MYCVLRDESDTLIEVVWNLFPPMKMFLALLRIPITQKKKLPCNPLWAKQWTLSCLTCSSGRIQSIIASPLKSTILFWTIFKSCSLNSSCKRAAPPQHFTSQC